MKRVATANIIVSLALVLSITLGAGCARQSEADTTPPSSPPATENTTLIDTEWSIPLDESQGPMLPSIADVVTKVKPSVVAITTEVTTFNIFGGAFTQEGAGSGWIVSEDGYVVTNNHVIEGAKNITVTLHDNKAVPAGIVGTDPLTDLAVLKINTENLTAATVGKSLELEVGDWVVAIGNALGEGISATAGIVSKLEVSLPVDQAQTLYDLIQTDAAINPGNSGGPLVNMAGEVIGITSIKIAQVGVEGMGYAISTNEVMPIIQQLINTGYVVRPWLGVSLYGVDQLLALRYNLAVDKGAFIVTAASGSPADKAGLKVGDVIVKFGDQEINDVDELIRAIHLAQIGQRIEITFWRGTNKNNTYASLIESPPPP